MQRECTWFFVITETKQDFAIIAKSFQFETTFCYIVRVRIKSFCGNTLIFDSFQNGLNIEDYKSI
jgi:hypothetical protein